MLLPKLPPLLVLPFGSLEFNEILKFDNTSRWALNSMNGDFNPRHLKVEEKIQYRLKIERFSSSISITKSFLQLGRSKNNHIIFIGIQIESNSKKQRRKITKHIVFFYWTSRDGRHSRFNFFSLFWFFWSVIFQIVIKKN